MNMAYTVVGILLEQKAYFALGLLSTMQYFYFAELNFCGFYMVLYPKNKFQQKKNTSKIKIRYPMGTAAMEWNGMEYL